MEDESENGVVEQCVLGWQGQLVIRHLCLNRGTKWRMNFVMWKRLRMIFHWYIYKTMGLGNRWKWFVVRLVDSG
jgi:hypothetical protein